MLFCAKLPIEGVLRILAFKRKTVHRSAKKHSLSPKTEILGVIGAVLKMQGKAFIKSTERSFRRLKAGKPR
jgi:hypothetical protein